MSEKKINNKKNINNQNNKNKGKSTGEKSKKPVIIGVIAIAVIIVAAVIVLALTGVFGEEKKKDAEFGKTKIPETICQYTPPVEGEITAEIYVKDYGVIKVKFFETIAPKAEYSLSHPGRPAPYPAWCWFPYRQPHPICLPQ